MPKKNAPLNDVDMPWCEHCQCYHSNVARHIDKTKKLTPIQQDKALLEAHKGSKWFFRPWLFKSWPLFLFTAFEYSLYAYGGMWLLHWLGFI